MDAVAFFWTWVRVAAPPSLWLLPMPVLPAIPVSLLVDVVRIRS